MFQSFVNWMIIISKFLHVNWTELTRSSKSYDADAWKKVDGEERYKLISSELGVIVFAYRWNRRLSFWHSWVCAVRFVIIDSFIYLYWNDLHLLPADGRMHSKSHVLLSCFRLLQVRWSGSVRSHYLCQKQLHSAMYEAVERGSLNTTDYRVYFSEL